MQHLPDQTQLWEMFVSISVLLVLFLSTDCNGDCIQTVTRCNDCSKSVPSWC